MHSVNPAHEDGSYWVLQEWLHALEQHPIQILEVSAELLWVFFGFTWNRNFLEQFKCLLWSVFTLYPYPQIYFWYPNRYRLRYDKFVSSSVFLLCGLWLHTLSITWCCIEQNMNSTGPISFGVRSVSVQEKWSSIVTQPDLLGQTLFWLAICHLTSGALNGARDRTELASHHQEEMQLRQTTSSPSWLVISPIKVAERPIRSVFVCHDLFFFNFIFKSWAFLFWGIYCIDNRSKVCYRFWKLELFLHYRLFHLPYKKKHRIRGTVIKVLLNHYRRFLAFLSYPVINVCHTYSTHI